MMQSAARASFLRVMPWPPSAYENSSLLRGICAATGAGGNAFLRTRNRLRSDGKPVALCEQCSAGRSAARRLVIPVVAVVVARLRKRLAELPVAVHEMAAVFVFNRAHHLQLGAAARAARAKDGELLGTGVAAADDL